MNTPLVTKDTHFRFRVRTTDSAESTYRGFLLTVIGWEVQNCKTCKLGNINIWSECNSELEVSSDGTRCRDTASTTTTALSTTVAVFVGISFALGIITSVLSVSSPNVIFSVINQMQLILILPLIGIYLPDQIEIFIEGIQYMTLNIPYLSVDSVPESDSYLSHISEGQNVQYLSRIEMIHTSTILNQSGTVAIIALSLMAHSVVFTLFWVALLLRKSGKILKVLRYLLKILTFGFYIRLILQVYLFLVISASNELYHFEYQKSYFWVSLLTTSMLLIWISMLWAKWLILWVKNRKEPSAVMESLFYELFNGLKHKFSCQAFIIVFIVKRTLLAGSLMLLQEQSGIVRLIIFGSVQVVCWAITIWIRPFSETQANIVEISNDSLFSIAWCMLFHYREEEKWGPVSEKIFIGLLMTGSVLSAFLSIIFIMISKSFFYECHRPVIS